MFLQGDLQAVFDALYIIGAIDPVLKMDWAELTKEMSQQPERVKSVVEIVNACQGDREMLLQKFNSLEKKAVQYIALEVAREFSEFQDRKELH